MKLSACMICKNKDLNRVLSLGETPLANSFLKKENLDSIEPFYPLEVVFCNNCSLVQLNYIVPPETMFKNYVYVSSTSNFHREHFRKLSLEMVERFSLSTSDLVIDIGSNDGSLLKEFKKLKVKVLGVDPATNVAELANSEGIETINRFFNEETASEILKNYGKAKVITATNVFAHATDLHGFVNGVYKLLDDNGLFIIETPYLVDLIQNIEFDTIYHEHLRYYSVKSLKILFDNHNMGVFDIQKNAIHGGTIRVFVKKNSNSTLKILDSVERFLNLENELNLYSTDAYLHFANKVEEIKRQLITLLKKLKSQGKRIAGYGAAAKGNTLLNYCSIGPELIDYIADKNTFKQGLLTPGTHIPVVSPERLLEDNPDYVLILAWNFANEIMQQQKNYLELGGKFIIPIPEPKIVS